MKNVFLIGLTNTGKDFISDNILSTHDKLTFANMIKYECVLRNKEWYLEQLKNVNEALDIDTIENISFHIEDVLSLLNKYKDDSRTNIRDKVRNFLEIQDSEGYDYWSKLLFKDLDSSKNYVVSDGRFLIEVIDALLNDFLVITIYNSRSEALSKYCNFHSTEILGGVIKSYHLWVSVDITTRDQELLKQTFTDVIKSCKVNYSEDFKTRLKEFREEILVKAPDLEKLLDKYYKEQNSNLYNQIYSTYLQYIIRLHIMIENEYTKIFYY